MGMTDGMTEAEYAAYVQRFIELHNSAEMREKYADPDPAMTPEESRQFERWLDAAFESVGRGESVTPLERFEVE